MEALWSQYRPLIRPDHTLLARLLQPKPGDIKSKVRLQGPLVCVCVAALQPLFVCIWLHTLLRTRNLTSIMQLNTSHCLHPTQVSRIAFVNNGAIRRHFHDLTAGLLQPLQPFIEPAAPGQALPAWDPDAFLANLKSTQAASVPSVVSDRWVLWQRY